MNSPDPVTQHAVSITILAAPTVSFWAHINPYLTGVLTCMGIVWYAYIFVKEINKWRRRHQYPKNH